MSIDVVLHLSGWPSVSTRRHAQTHARETGSARGTLMPSSPGRFLNSIQTRGIRDTANLVLDRALQQPVARLSRSARNPSLGDLYRAAEAVCGTTEGVLQTIFPAVSPTETASLRPSSCTPCAASRNPRMFSKPASRTATQRSFCCKRCNETAQDNCTAQM